MLMAFLFFVNLYKQRFVWYTIYMIDRIGKFTKIIDIEPSGRKSDYRKLYKSFLKIANQKAELSLDEAVDFITLIAKTRTNETNLSAIRISLVNEMPERTRGSFDGNSWQIFLPDTIFQKLTHTPSGKQTTPRGKIVKLIKDINTVAHEIDHNEYESYLQGNYALGVKKKASKEEYREIRLDCLKDGILKFKDKHFSSILACGEKKFDANFYHVMFGKYFTSRYETRARTSALEYTNNLFLSSQHFIETHPIDAITMGAAFLTSHYNFSMSELFRNMSSVVRDARIQEDIDMSDNLFRLEPTQPIIAAVTQFQESYFSTLQQSEARIIELYSKISKNIATKEEADEYSEMLDERCLFEDSFALIQNEDMAHEIAFMPGVNPSLKATALLYSSASISSEEVATIYRDERYYRAHPELSIPSNLSATPGLFREYNQSEISFIRHSVYSETEQTE